MECLSINLIVNKEQVLLGKYPFISLVVCTRNRATKLTSALVAFSKIEYAGKYEVILVDNGSTDATKEVIESFIIENSVPFKYVYEEKAGLSRARNTGVSNTKGEIIAFTDDDCYPREDFLQKIASCFSDETIAYAGGRLLLYDSTDRRVTIQEKKDSQVLDANTFIPSGLIHGANVSVKRTAILALNGFDERLGAGTEFKSGEDTDLLRRLSNAGYNGFYEPNIVVFHHHGRKTLEDEINIRKGYDRGVGSCMLKQIVNKKTRHTYMKRWYWMLRKSSTKTKARQLWYALKFYFKYGPSFTTVLEHPHECLNLKKDTTLSILEPIESFKP